MACFEGAMRLDDCASMRFVKEAFQRFDGWVVAAMVGSFRCLCSVVVFGHGKVVKRVACQTGEMCKSFSAENHNCFQINGLRGEFASRAGGPANTMAWTWPCRGSRSGPHKFRKWT